MNLAQRRKGAEKNKNLSLRVSESLRENKNTYTPGHVQHANCYRLIRLLFERHAWLELYFRCRRPKKGQRWKLERLYLSPQWFWNLRAQYIYFTRRWYHTLVFFQVGCFYEFYGKQAAIACQILNLSRISGKFGFKRRCGICVKALERYVKLAVEQGYSVAVVEQSGYLLRHVAERRVTMRYIVENTLTGKKENTYSWK